MLLKSPSHYRGVKAQATRFGNHEVAAKAAIGLRASKIAAAIKAANADEPPLPPEVIAALCGLLLARQAGVA